MGPPTRIAALLCAVIGLGLCADKSFDQVDDLPGVMFDVRFKHYSGYLDASPGNHLHYWLLEAQSNPGNAPLVLWLNGGPGCSSLGGLFTEHGPFHPTEDGEHLQENVFSWNKIANMLYLESPRQVGFSYRDGNAPDDQVYNDDKTASDTVLALKSFFKAYPEYQYRDFYVTGESYGGVYVPTLVDALIKELDKENNGLPMNLIGFAIGNGEMNELDQINSAIDLQYFRGMIGKDDYDTLYDCCQKLNKDEQFVYCNFTNYFTLDDYGNAVANVYNDEADQKCADTIVDFGYNLVWNTTNDVYNTYTDCYNKAQSASVFKRIKASSRTLNLFGNYEEPFVDQGSLGNSDSTDAMGGFLCYMGDATEKYLNKKEVRRALHIPDTVRYWTDCDDDINEIYYHQQHHDTGDVFDSIINSGHKIRFLLFNGDADMACNFMGDQWFTERLAARNNIPVSIPHTNWDYTRAPGMMPRGSGFAKRFQTDDGQVTIDMLTVKGGGHYVPTDRPGPALQMFTNFLYGFSNYSHMIDISLTPAALLPEYQLDEAPALSRKEADRVYDLPGVTFEFNFNQYAGYLSGVKGNYIHYWFVESQRSPANDPLVLWLTGGPGCSGYSAFLTENGPFHPNRDGETLYENVFAWNKVANMLFVESPRGVGFSFQNFTENPDPVYDDDRTAKDLYYALKDFLEVYPEYKGRPFYITGESYGGIYIPTTTSYLIDRITEGNFDDLNLQGIAIGNGQLSGLLQVNAALQMQYFHGAYGKDEHDALMDCCPKAQHPGDPTYFEYCDFTPYIYLDRSGNVTPRDPNNDCSVLVAKYGQQLVFGSGQDVYNLYQSCYEPGQAGNARPNLKKPVYADPNFVDQALLVSHEASDSEDGFLCWMDDATTAYMNLPEVQAALHVRDDAENGTVLWDECSDAVGNAYFWQHNDTTVFFDNMIQKQYPLRVLIYNGDVDSACNFLADQWFVENLAQKHNLSLKEQRAPWRYLTQIAGYTQRFSKDKFTVDLLTVKGAGHFVPSDRPGPALQMISAFFNEQPYNSPLSANVDLANLKDQYQMDEQIGQLPDTAEKKETVSRAKRATKTLPDPPQTCNKANDLITNLPGFTFEFTPKQYSGYVKPSDGNYLHYWLIEADQDAANKPLILWLNGGPGCSSLNGLMQELGPFLSNKDGKTLYENVFSWHKVANLLFLESPRDVGYSYSANDAEPSNVYNDDLTAADNVNSLEKFLDCYPEYKNRPFFLMGESYGGVYVPTFTDGILKKKLDNGYVGSLKDLNFQGIAIGNGILSAIQQINSAVSLTYFRGIHGKEDYDMLAKCAEDADGPMTYYDWTKYIYVDDKGNANPKNPDESTLEGYCGAQVVRQGFMDVWDSGNNVYNTYQDCYIRNQMPPFPGAKDKKRVKRDAYSRPVKYDPFIDEAKRMNYYSTDSSGGYYCYDGMDPYLNSKEVRDALHIPTWFTKEWDGCNDDMNDYYVQQHNDTTSVFESIIDSVTLLGQGSKLRILIYNGDVDMACQFLGDQWFTENLVKRKNMEMTKEFAQWKYHQLNSKDSDEVGGYVKSFSYHDGSVTVDLLTVKGAGHLVPIDRPGPILQVINNFVHHNGDYDYGLYNDISIDRKPLLDSFYGESSKMMRRKMDKINGPLPGLTFQPPFGQHAGYLQASEGNKLFYWFIEAQNADANTPVALWLNGGPGCSSLGGLILENGPFRPNPDGRTLFENVYAWNKAAHILYIDSPRGVGYSFQDFSKNADTEYTDTKTISDLYLALEDFFVAYSNFANKDFYITGESYGGIYVPTLTAYLVNKINDGSSKINLKGMAVGNGEVSQIQATRSDIGFAYFHGLIGKDQYDSFADCCPDGGENDVKSGLYCHYDWYFKDVMTLEYKDNLTPDQQQCADKIFDFYNNTLGDDWMSKNDVYNIYQDCYDQTTASFGSAASLSAKRRSRTSASLRRSNAAELFQQSVVEPKPKQVVSTGQMDPMSTDAQGGFQCFMNNAAQAYLSLKTVRTALHVADAAGAWDFCNDPINDIYQSEHQDTSSEMETIMNSGLNLRVLLYNGDLDTACSFLEAQWYAEKFAHDQKLEESEYGPWHHRGVIAGYTQRFSKEGFQLDIMTVKGAGHFVPTDRPGPTLQMIGAFFRNEDYETPIPYSLEKQPLLPQYTRGGTVTGSTESTTPSTTESQVSTEESSSPSTTSHTTTPTQPTTTTSASITSILTTFIVVLSYLLF